MKPLDSVDFSDLPYKVHLSEFKLAYAEWCNAHVPNQGWEWWLEIDPNSANEQTVFGFRDQDLAMQFRITF